jgi:hypothetical protein
MINDARCISRLGVIVKVALKSKVSIFVEFGLQLVADVFKSRTAQQQMDELEEDGTVPSSSSTIAGTTTTISWADAALVDSFVPITIDALKLKYDKVR